MRRIRVVLTVGVMVAVLLLTMSAAPAVANDRGDRDHFNFLRTPFLVFDHDFDRDHIDVDTFDVGGVPCFSTEDGIAHVFCVVNGAVVRVT